MTVEMFAALEAQIPSVEARQKMGMAEAALYAQIDPKHARELWAHWARQANPPPPVFIPPSGGGSRFYFNGSVVSPTELRTQLAGALGSGLVSA